MIVPGRGPGAEPGGPGTPATTPVALEWRPSGKVVAEGAAAALALLAAVVTGDVALVALATPLALATVLALSRRRPDPPEVGVEVTPLVSRPSAPVTFAVALRSDTPSICEVRLCLPPGLESDDTATWTVRLRRGEPRLLTCKVRATRAGRFRAGTVALRVTDTARALVGRGTGGLPVVVESRPAPLGLRNLVRPEQVRATAGDRVARTSGDGIEFAEVRQELAGALRRRINWRASARRGTTCINLQHPERSTDVVLLVDTFTEALLPSVVSIAAGLAETYLRRHDRLGLIAFGGVLDWVEPGTGPAHLERVRGCLLSSEAFFSYAMKTADVIPRRLFPAGCLVLAVSPLGDGRFVSTLASLRSRGMDLAVIELEPPWPAGEPDGPAAAVARRLVTMERLERRRRFWRMGVPVVTVEGPDELAPAVAEIVAFRRGLRARSGSALPARSPGR